jgi:hypothetical protein
MSFQTQVNNQQAPGVTGDFASANPRADHVSAEAGFIVGVGGITAGRFVWIESDGRSVINSGSDAPNGFVSREEQGMITEFLAESSMFIPQGSCINIWREGDFFALNAVGSSLVGQKVFASNTNGSIQTAAAGTIISGYTETNFVVRSPALINELAKISSSVTNQVDAELWHDEFDNIWEDETSDPWST